MSKDPDVLAKLLSHLEYEYNDSTDYVNLNEFRDQLAGRREANGFVYCWGLNENGRLGRKLQIKKDKDEEKDNRDKKKEDEEKQKKLECGYAPHKVSFPKPRPIILKVACGSTHTLAITYDGKY